MLLQLELVTALVIRSSGLGTDLDSKSGGKRLANRIQSANGFISFHHVSPCFSVKLFKWLKLSFEMLRDSGNGSSSGHPPLQARHLSTATLGSRLLDASTSFSGDIVMVVWKVWKLLIFSPGNLPFLGKVRPCLVCS